MLTEEITAAIGEETLKNLGISAENIDEIQTVPFEALSKAAGEAIRKVGDDLKKVGKGIGSFGLSWGPSVDDNLLPYQLLDEDALQLSKKYSTHDWVYHKRVYAFFRNKPFFCLRR